MKQRVKLAVTGAAGQIGYALLFRIAAGEMFGPDTEVELNLLELEQALKPLEGVVMELLDCAFPLLRNVQMSSDVNKIMDGVDWAVLVGAAPRKEGMERSDLLEKNASIFAKQGQAINNYANDDVHVFVVGNPCNTNCLIAMNHAPDVPNDRFFAMTMLDEKRARAQLALKANADIRSIKRMNIWGNHSSTQYPDFYHAEINGQPALEVIGDETWLQETFIKTVQQRGAEVIKARGASSAASAANAAIASVYQLTHDTPEDDMFSVALCSQGEYDIDPGLIFSYPCRSKAGQVEIVKDIEHNDFGKEKLQQTHEELRQEREIVKKLGLI